MQHISKQKKKTTKTFAIKLRKRLFFLISDYKSYAIKQIEKMFVNVVVRI